MIGGLIAVIVAAAAVIAAPPIAQWVARTDQSLARLLLGPSRSDELALQVESMARVRTEILAATDAERRRIERDLHDGAQQRLVSLAMNLGMARATLTDTSEPVRQAIADAHEEALLALTELREFIRGLHPAVLNDRGLDAALSGIAAHAPLPVRLQVDVEPRCSASIEAVAYFIVSEALTNVAKYAQATQRRGDRHPDRRRAAHRRPRRRARRRGHPQLQRRWRRWTGQRDRTARPDATRGFGRRDTDHRQPTRRADDYHGGAAMRIVIAEDSVLLRAGLTKLLTDGGFDVVAAVGNADELLQAVAEHRPDVAVIDVRMPPTHTDEGIRAALVIRRQHPEVAVMVLSQYVEERYATDLLSVQTSSVGYLLKDRVAHVSDFLDALRRVAAGGTALDPEVVAQLLVRHHDDPLERLTPRELDVLRLMAEGRSNNGIVEALRVSPSAVEKYVTNILSKLDLPPVDTDHRRVLAVLKFLRT